MATYATWLEGQDRLAELTILRLIGLFDRPAEPEAMTALLSDPQMRVFTGELPQGGDAWNAAVDALRQMGLLNREFPDLPGTLDAHPLVREHFRDQLRRKHKEWWLQGNRTLFGYYQTQAPPLPDNSKDMNVLYAAVTHGCAAGLYQQVFSDVLLKRVWRDRRTNFSTRRLGMTGSDLVALSNYFYPQQWTQLRNTVAGGPGPCPRPDQRRRTAPSTRQARRRAGLLRRGGPRDRPEGGAGGGTGGRLVRCGAVLRTAGDRGEAHRRRR